MTLIVHPEKPSVLIQVRDLKKYVKEQVQKPRTAYEVVSEARTKVIKNKPKWEPEDSEPRLS